MGGRRDTSACDRPPTRRRRSAVITMGPPMSEPWWWKDIDMVRASCGLEFRRVIFRNKRSQEVKTFELPALLLKMLLVHLQLRKRYDYVFTFECDLPTFAIAFWQTVFRTTHPRHVILQFIMREETKSLRSRVKYVLMRWCFSRVHRVMCSSTEETEYYKEAFRWPLQKVAFVPLHTSRSLVRDDVRALTADAYVLAAGRTFRDYPTLLEAVSGADYRTVVVAQRGSIRAPVPSNLELHEDIPSSLLETLMDGATVVVVPLTKLRISAGQLVLLQAMAGGKAIVASNTGGMADYIQHEVSGLLVEPGDPGALRAAIDRLMGDESLRIRLGRTAREAVVSRHLPDHYGSRVKAMLAAECGLSGEGRRCPR